MIRLYIGRIRVIYIVHFYTHTLHYYNIQIFATKANEHNVETVEIVQHKVESLSRTVGNDAM